MDGGADEKWKVVASSKTNEGTARIALNKILKLSIERRREYGAMICLKAGQYVAFMARTQDEPNTVDVGQHVPRQRIERHHMAPAALDARRRD